MLTSSHTVVVPRHRRGDDTTAATPDDPPHVYSVEWTELEAVFGIDGREHHRERRGVALRRQHVVRSGATSDYEVVEVVEVLALGRLGSPHASHARARAAAGRRRP